MDNPDLVVIDRKTGKEYWTSSNAAEYCSITPNSWRHYHRMHFCPNPVTKIGNIPLWDADEVKTWHANRPRAGKE